MMHTWPKPKGGYQSSSPRLGMYWDMDPVTMTSMYFARGHSRRMIPCHDGFRHSAPTSSAAAPASPVLDITSSTARRAAAFVTIEALSVPEAMSWTSSGQCSRKKLMPRRNPDANTAPIRTTWWR